MIAALKTLLAAAVALAFGCLGAAAQGASQAHVFMVLHRSDAGADQGFRDHLARSGLDLRFTMRSIENDYARLPAIVEEIRAQKPDLVYAQSTIVTQAVAGLADSGASPIGDIPVVFSMVADPVGSKLTKTLESSGRSLTGAIHVVSLPVQLNAMLSVKAVRKLGLIYNPAEDTQVILHDQLKALAAAKGVELVAVHPLDAQGAPQLGSLGDMVDRLAAEKPDLVYLPPINILARHSDVLMAELARRGLPTFCATDVQINAGGLMGLVAPFYNVGALAGVKAETILRKKALAKDIPIEPLSRFAFILNLETADKLSFLPPFDVLRVAQIMRGGAK